ncbi:MAG: class II glutamine amidotransferase [Myxococcota bacterium]
MCRLFGFRSVIRSQVHRSLLAADNALGKLSNDHPDGWGVAYYIDGSPHVTRSPTTALGDQLFHRVSGVVASETVLAHVRKATKGELNVLNCHPFQYGRWTFAHNGDIPNFADTKAELVDLVDPGLRRYILGDTDSEVVFSIFLTQLRRAAPLSNHYAIEEVANALRESLFLIRDICDGDDEKDEALLTMIVTDGTTMAGVQSGKELYWSTHKTRCGDRAECPHLSEECEAPRESGHVNHLLFSSEPIAGENVWRKMEKNEVVGVDWRMRLTRSHINRRRLSVAI